ncbi:hypothetical protein SAMN04487972_108140 [Paracoccus halophilus]|uniref:Uncharacterized protein n=1 Tax=Paracoccus halophilus TaxID=376733 RepID=A0A099F3N9_9RHOB|nr:hypothetical protein [Paracoccus halophilus]KGJ04846.1 hypothetical protein IT41_09300 [Paracoccus halophilus]SFA51491.1 hypothetical protein SAMN04487972_108140 [Paracoccus halophilus]
MAVTIQNGVSTALFQGVAQVYLAGREVALLNADGAPLTGAPDPETAPVVTLQPAILPEGAGIGDSVTLSIGAAEGTPAPTALWDITLNGESIRDRLDAGVMTLALSEPGVYELTVSWTNSAGIATAETATLSVVEQPDPDPTGIDYDSQALVYLDADTAFDGSASDVTSVTARGTGGYVFAKVDSGAAIQRTPDGFLFSDGAYLRTATLDDVPSTDGIFAVAEVTLNSYGSSAGQILEGTGGYVKLLDIRGTFRTMGVDDSSVSLVLDPVTYGARVVIAGCIDDVLDRLGGIGSNGIAAETDMPMTDPAAMRFLTGRFVNGTLHRLAIVARAEGQPWPVTMQAVYEDFQAKA